MPQQYEYPWKVYKKVKKRTKKSLLASWDKFTQVKGPFHVEENPLPAAGEKKNLIPF